MMNTPKFGIGFLAVSENRSERYSARLVWFGQRGDIIRSELRVSGTIRSSIGNRNNLINPSQA